MRIAFDGEFDRLPPSGIGGYVRHLTTELTRVDPGLDLNIIHPGWDHTGSEPAKGLRDRRIQRASWELFGFARAAGRIHHELLHIPSFAAPLRSPTPYVITIHDMIPFVLPAYRASKPMRIHMEIMRRTARRAALIIAPSNSAASEIASLLPFPRERIRVTPEGAGEEYRPIPDPFADQVTRAKFGISGRYIFNVGGLDVRKNVPLLIEAFAKVRADLKESIQLVIAGAAHSENPVVFPPLAPIIRSFGLAGSVVCTGRVSEADKVRLYQGAALYVTPSAHEGFGLTALEAMACGVPTIAANRTSFPEVVGDGGVLVDLDSSAIAAAMIDLLQDADRAADLRARGMAQAATFTWRRTAEQTLEIYREVLTMGISQNGR